ncbi:MAG: hypothetical protein L6R35_001255 [Caloplaca aegaea]|nr:MAG: hypothetical protein L6R35_001255 [Caloplaca aegaea]
MADSTPKSYHTDPTLYLYTSLTAGSSHIITATSRLETILKANRIPFQALDVATDEKARMLWGRRAGKKKLPGLVRMGMLVGDLEDIEEWNEYGELKEKVGVPARSSTPSAANTPTKAPQSYSAPSNLSTTNTLATHSPSLGSPSKPSTLPQPENPMTSAMRQAGMEAAKKAGDAKAKVLAKAGMASTESPETPSKPVGSESTDTSNATELKDVASGKDQATADTETDAAASPKTIAKAPRDDVYEGRGSKDPDEDAVIPNSKETIDVDDNTESVNEDSKDDDPDADAVVPGSKDRVDAVEERLPPPGLESQDSEDDESDDVANDGRTTVKTTTKETAASDDAQNLPGKRTQNQVAAKGDEAGASVAD